MHTLTKQERTLLGHPFGLFVLFFTEMWERMSFYGMRALLTLYMVEHLFIKPQVGAEVLGFNAIRGFLESIFGPLTNTGADGTVSFQPLGSQVYGLYTGLVYFTPFFGGMLADRILGQRKTVIVGAVLMAIGHFLMASESLFFLALFFLILGNGAFKANISTQVGGLYKSGDPRRDRAFTIFYMGINLGALFSPLICGTLGQKVGWHWGFGAAGVGMIIGLIGYLWGQKYLAADNIMRTAGRVVKEPLTSTQRKGIIALIVLCALNIVFWGVYEQQGNTMQLWADNNTNWNFFGWEVPSTWFQSLNPFLIVAFAPVVNIFWAWQNRRGREPSTVGKMAIACFLLGSAFVVMILAAQAVPADQKGSIGWLFGCTFVLTIGELYLSPIGLSLVSKVAPPRLVSTMMGMWFLSSFFGNYLSGFLGTFYERMPKDSFFMVLTGLAIATGVVMWLFNRPLRSALRTTEKVQVA